MSRRTARPRCAMVSSESDLEQLQADGTITLVEPDDTQEWENDDGVRRVEVVDVARIRAAINGRHT